MKNMLRIAIISALALSVAGAFGVAAQQQASTVVAPPSSTLAGPNPGLAMGQSQAVTSADQATYQNTQQGTPPAQPATQGQAPNPYVPQQQVAPPIVPQSAQQVVAAQAPPMALPSQLPPLPPYQQFVEQSFPVSPEQIQALRRTINATQQAVARPVAPPKPQTGSISVSLAPGATPPKIRAYFGNTSSIVVVDSSGAPWPVENFRLGNASAFQLNRMDGGQGSSFALDANMPHAQSNVLLQLVGTKSPVILEIVAGQPEYDARLEIRVQGRGPNSTASSVNTLPSGTDGRLLSILDGVAPSGSKALNVSSGNAQAWMLPSGRMVVRTPVKIVSPAPTSFVSSADGTHVYEFMPTSDLLGMSNGDFVNITVKGW